MRKIDFDYDWEEDDNEDVEHALEWAEWLVQVKDPGPALLAAKKHADTFLSCYRMMSYLLNAYEYGTP